MDVGASASVRNMSMGWVLVCQMGKCDEKTNTGEGGKGKRVRTTSDDTGGKSVSEKSKSTGGQCVGEKLELHRWEIWCDTEPRSSTNIFEASRRENPILVDTVKDKRKYSSTWNTSYLTLTYQLSNLADKRSLLIWSC